MTTKYSKIFRAAATEIISSYCFAVKEAMLGNNVNVDLYDINAGASINQVKVTWHYN
jgi:hypothetical protein